MKADVPMYPLQPRLWRAFAPISFGFHRTENGFFYLVSPALFWARDFCSGTVTGWCGLAAPRLSGALACWLFPFSSSLMRGLNSSCVWGLRGFTRPPRSSESVAGQLMLLLLLDHPWLTVTLSFWSVLHSSPPCCITTLYWLAHSVF